MANRILIIGGTGTIGKSLLEALSETDHEITALARTEDKAVPLQEQGIQTHIGSLGDWDNIEPLLDQIDTIFLLTSPSPEQVALQNGLIDRAKAHGVRKIVKVSAVGAAAGAPIHLGDWHGQIEDHLKASGMEYVILQPHSFMQNVFMSLPTIKEQGAIYQSLGAAKIPMVDTRDVAQACARCLVTDDFNNETFVITGAEAIGYAEVASSLSESSGKNIQYVAITPEAHNQAMKEAGVPDWLADDLTMMSSYWSQKEEHPPSGDLEKITGSRPYTVRDFARDYGDQFK